MPLGSFSGGFSSTAGYVPGNEAFIRRRERRSTHLADHFQRALLVFIRVTFEKSEDFSSKPFGFGSGRTRQRLSAPTVRKLCVTAQVPLPDTGQNARKQSRQ